MESVEDQIREAQELIDGGNPRGALKILRRVQLHTSGDQRVRVHELQANAYRNLGALERADYHMKRATHFTKFLAPTRLNRVLESRLYRDHANVLLDLGYPNDALKKVEQSIDLHARGHEFGATLGTKARCMVAKRNYRQARELFEMAHAIIFEELLSFEVQASNESNDHLHDMIRQCQLYMLNNLIAWLKVLPMKKQLRHATLGIRLALRFKRVDRVAEILILIIGGAPLHAKWRR
jgi:tetratricopeptide (TPR) repeat protein